MTKTQQSKKSNNPERLGDIVNKVLKEKVSPKQAKFSRLVNCWSEILPSELVEHCCIEDISAGQLVVRVDAPSYKYELQLCREEVVQQLNNKCSSARIEKIKIINS
jgi:hypothetical protein